MGKEKERQWRETLAGGESVGRMNQTSNQVVCSQEERAQAFEFTRIVVLYALVYVGFEYVDSVFTSPVGTLCGLVLPFQGLQSFSEGSISTSFLGPFRGYDKCIFRMSLRR